MAWSMLARFSSLGEAESARSALEAAGIEVAIADEGMIGVNWLYANAVGGVKLYVPDEAREDSEAVIATPAERVADDSAAAEPAAETGEAALVCPACGRAEVALVPKPWLFLFFMIVCLAAGVVTDHVDLGWLGVIVIALILVAAPSHRCKVCGARWSEGDRPPDAPPPSAGDMADDYCPRCGWPEFHLIDYRRLKAVPFFLDVLAPLIVAIWWALPKRRCDVCAFKR